MSPCAHQRCRSRPLPLELRDRLGCFLLQARVGTAVHGSRANGMAAAGADLDIAVRVSPEEFDALIEARFKNPKPGSAKWETRRRAIETGKIQSGEAGLRRVRKEVEAQLGWEVDLSVVKIGGAFDEGPYIQLDAR